MGTSWEAIKLDRQRTFLQACTLVTEDWSIVTQKQDLALDIFWSKGVGMVDSSRHP